MDNEINLFIEITGKRIADKYIYPAEDFKFGAYLRAENKCRQLGLTIGNMYMDYPIGLTKTDCAHW